MGRNSLGRQDVAISHLAGLLRHAASSSTKLVENTVRANDQLESIRDVFNSEWYFALSEFDQELEDAQQSSGEASAKKVSVILAALQAAWTLSLGDAMVRSFRKGYGNRGRQDASSLTREKVLAGSPIFRMMMDKQASFANQFASQYAAGETDRKGAMGVGARTNMYGQALKGAYNAGAVFGGIGGEKIFWRLGACDHCVDCPALSASSPFTRATLPTLPGNGDTVCKTNCCCYLVFVRAPKEVEPDDTVDSWMSDGPDVQEDESQDKGRRDLQDLMLQRSFLRRYALGRLDVTQEEVDAAARESKGVSVKVDSLAKSLGLDSAARYNPSAVITRADISYNDIGRMFDAGIDGPSIFRADMKKAIGELDSVAKLYSSHVSRSTKIPKSSLDPDRVPKVGTFITYNLVADGAVKTWEMLRSLLQILSESEIFIEIGSLDDSMERAVGYSGVWLRGQNDEVDMAVSLLRDSGAEVGVAEVILV